MLRSRDQVTRSRDEVPELCGGSTYHMVRQCLCSTWTTQLPFRSADCYCAMFGFTWLTLGGIAGGFDAVIYDFHSPQNYTYQFYCLLYLTSTTRPMIPLLLPSLQFIHVLATRSITMSSKLCEYDNKRICHGNIDVGNKKAVWKFV